MLTDERCLSKIAPALQCHFQELRILIHKVVLLLQRDPGPVQSERLWLQLVAPCLYRNVQVGEETGTLTSGI